MKKFVTGDYVGNPYGCAKLGANPSMGGSEQMSEMWRNFYLFIYTFLGNSPTSQTRQQIHAWWLKRHGLTFWGFADITSHIGYIWISKIQDGWWPQFWKPLNHHISGTNGMSLMKSGMTTKIGHTQQLTYDAYWPTTAERLLKFQILENPRRRQLPSWKSQKNHIEATVCLILWNLEC